MSTVGRQYKADPGIGRDDAPIGSEQWAQAVRLHLQSAVKDLDWEPQRVKRYYDLVSKHRAWTLMNKPDGSYFATWEEFCEHPQPWGLGRPWEEIRLYLEAAVGKRAMQVETVAPAAKTGPKPKDESGVTIPGHGVRKTSAEEKREVRLRAIAERAPEPVRDLYREGLIGAKEAAALGPKNPKPDDAARVTAIAIEAREIASRERPKTEREKRQTQRKVNETVRARLGRDADPVREAARVIARVPTHRFAEFVACLPEQTIRLFLMCVQDRIGGSK